MNPSETSPASSAICRTNTPNIMFLCDIRGRILYWSGPCPGGMALSEPTGQHLSQWLPALPLRPETPGYNLAFIRMVFHDGLWQASQLRTPDGGVRPVQLYLQAVALDRGYWLTGIVRVPATRPLASHAQQDRTHRSRPPFRMPFAGDRRTERLEVLPPLMLDFSRPHSERRADRLMTLAP